MIPPEERGVSALAAVIETRLDEAYESPHRAIVQAVAQRRGLLEEPWPISRQSSFSP
jgi:hypothetical protein